MLAKTTRLNMLYDFYDVLLTEKQRNYMELYYREDYSLGEIASKSEVSRQTVYDTIKRTEQVLEAYEEKLQLYKKYTKRMDLLDELEKELASTVKEQSTFETIKKVVMEIRKLE